METDQSKHNICIASIKRKTFKPYDYKLTKFYESNTDFNYSGMLDLNEDELIICSTIIDSENYSILTTQRLITKEKGFEKIGSLVDATDKLYGDFKGYLDEPFTFGLLQLASGIEMRYFIETGKASMIMIYGIRTIIRTQRMKNKQIDNLTKNWNKKNE